MSIITSLSGNITDDSKSNDSEAANESARLPAVERKLGIALVGLGTYSEQQLAPALTETEYCHLTGAVSGSDEKLNTWRVRYNLPETNLYRYEDFDSIVSNRDIDIVYIVLPNSMHADYVIRAAQAGKHVICEKPMATNAADCRRMIDACKHAGVKLSVGYRLHFDPFNTEMMRLGQKSAFGRVKHVIARNGMDVGPKDQWRLNQELAGGGPLMDLGIYCVQGALYTLGELPISVTARFMKTTDAEKFSEVEEGIEWTMLFPSGAQATCQCSYTREADILRGEARNGWFELQPAYAYNGLKGKTSGGPMYLSSINQQAAQMDDFALCVQNNRDTHVPGEMGLRDVQIIEAIYESANSDGEVALHLSEFEHMIEM